MQIEGESKVTKELINVLLLLSRCSRWLRVKQAVENNPIVLKNLYKLNLMNAKSHCSKWLIPATVTSWLQSDRRVYSTLISSMTFNKDANIFTFT